MKNLVVLITIILATGCSKESNYEVAAEFMQEAAMAIKVGDYNTACGLLSMASHATRKTGDEKAYANVYKSEQIACKRTNSR